MSTVGQTTDDDARLRARVEAELRDQGFSVPSPTPRSSHASPGCWVPRTHASKRSALAAIKRRLAALEVRWRPGVDDTDW
jgi:hypothetical protein